jgi:tRNA_anti-like
MKKIVLLMVFVAVVALWHIFVAVSMDNAYWSINPLTDVATVKMPGAASVGITDPMEKAGFEGGRSLVAVPIAENKLNLYARQYFDIYVWIVPYRVSVTDKPVESASSLVQPTNKSLRSAPLDTHIYHVVEIRSEFQNNEPRATALHKGAIMFVQGVTGKLLTNADTDDHVVMLHDQDTHDAFVACRMTDSDLSVLAERNNPGTVVVLSGECRGWVDGALWFKQCKLEEVVR